MLIADAQLPIWAPETPERPGVVGAVKPPVPGEEHEVQS